MGAALSLLQLPREDFGALPQAFKRRDYLSMIKAKFGERRGARRLRRRSMRFFVRSGAQSVRVIQSIYELGIALTLRLLERLNQQ